MKLRLVPLSHHIKRVRALRAARYRAEREAQDAWNLRRSERAKPAWAITHERAEELERINERLWSGLEEVKRQRDRLLMERAQDERPIEPPTSPGPIEPGPDQQERGSS